MSTAARGGGTDAVTVDWQWTDYQAEVRDALEAGAHDLVVLRTGYGGGKSICGAQWIHRGALQDRAGTGESLVMGQDFAKAEATTFKVFFETLPGENTVPDDDEGDPENSPIVAGHNEVKNRVTYVTGHVARLGSADKWNRYAGAEFNRIWCDEVGHYPPHTDLYKLHEMLVTRQRTDGGPNTTLWTSTGNGFNQFYDITERQVTKEEEPLPWRDRMKVVVASTEHNVLLPEDGLQKIKDQFQGTEREEQGLHGGFAAAEGLVYGQFSRNTHVRPRDQLRDRLVDGWRLYGYDAGWDDPRVIVEIARTDYDQYVVWDEFYESGVQVGDPDDPAPGTAVHWLQDKQRGRMYCEHEPGHIQTFRQAGFDARQAAKDLDEGIPHVRGRLEADSEGRPGLLVAAECTNVIQEFQSYKTEHVGKDIAKDHAMDGTRYALYTHDQQESSGDVRQVGSMRDIL